MKTAFFYNFTTQPYTGHWDGKPRTTKPGEKKLLEEYLARHFAIGLTNRVLLERKPDGSLVIPGGENYTSPKFPEQVPQFMEIFNKCFIPNPDSDDEDEAGVQTQILNPAPQRERTVVDNQPPQIIPSADEDDEFVDPSGQPAKA